MLETIPGKQTDSQFTVGAIKSGAGVVTLKGRPTSVNMCYYPYAIDFGTTVAGPVTAMVLGNSCLKLTTAATVTVADNAVLQFAGLDFLIGFWIKTSDVSYNVLISNKETGGAGEGYVIEITAAGKIKVTVEDNSGNTVNLTQGTAIDDNLWHHIAITAERGETDGLIINLDGSVDGTSSDFGNIVADISPTGAGGLVLTGETSKTCYLASLVFFSKADLLGTFTSKIATLYNSGKGYKIVGTETDLLFGMNLDEGRGTQASDIGATLNGTLSVAAWANISPLGENREDLGPIGPMTVYNDSGRFVKFPYAHKVGRRNNLTVVVSNQADFTVWYLLESCL